MNKANLIRNHLLLVIDEELRRSEKKILSSPQIPLEDFSVNFTESFSSNTVDTLSLSNKDESNDSSDIQSSISHPKPKRSSYLKEVCSLFKKAKPSRVIKKARTSHQGDSISLHNQPHSKSPSKKIRTLVKSFFNRKRNNSECE